MPGTPIAKSHSFSSVYCFTCFGFINCSASALRSSGLSAANSSGCRSPLRRNVGGRPTLRCRSEALSRTSCCRTALKSRPPLGLSVASWPGGLCAVVVLGIGIDPEEDLSVFHRLRVLREDVLHDTGEL